MPKRFQFVKDTCVDGVPFKLGQVIGEAEVPADHLACCKRLGYLSELGEAASYVASSPKSKDVVNQPVPKASEPKATGK